MTETKATHLRQEKQGVGVIINGDTEETEKLPPPYIDRSPQTIRLLAELVRRGGMRREVYETAERLINSFGTLSAVLEAELGVLKLWGLTENAALLLKQIPFIAGKILDNEYNIGHQYQPVDDLKSFFLGKLFGRQSETLYLLLLDSDRRALYCEVTALGNGVQVKVPVYRIVDLCTKYKGVSSMAIAHNHPNGDAKPSKGDLEATAKLLESAKRLGIELEDHLIFSGYEFFSMRGEGILTDEGLIEQTIQA